MKLRKLTGLMAGIVVSAATAMAAEPGEKAPDFTLKSTNGEDVTLSDFRGRIVVLEWTNYDCPFVKKHYASGNMPALQEKYTAENVVWLVINSSAEGKGGYLPPTELGSRSEKEGSKATHVLLDTGGGVGRAYGAKTTPHMFVIGKDGTIAYAGGIDNKATTEMTDVEGATNYVVMALDSVMKGGKVKTPKAKPYGCGVKY